MTDKPKLAIDINSLNNITMSGKRMSGVDLFNLFEKTGFLFYNSEAGEKPILIEGEVKIVDWNTPEGKRMLDSLNSTPL